MASPTPLAMALWALWLMCLAHCRTPCIFGNFRYQFQVDLRGQNILKKKLWELKMTFLPEDFMLSVATGAIEAVEAKVGQSYHCVSPCHHGDCLHCNYNHPRNHHCHHQHKENSGIPGPYLSVAIITIAGTTQIPFPHRHHHPHHIAGDIRTLKDL